MDNKSSKKVVIITGTSSGIGRAIALRAARKGYRLALNARREDRLNELAKQIESMGGQVLTVAGDITQTDTQDRLINETLDKYGRIDILVNNAGLPLPSAFSSSSREELRRQWDTNVTTLATLTRTALPYLEESKGTVINIGSSISHFAVPGMGNYAPTKIAVTGISNALLTELAPKGIKVCLVEPGPIATEFTERAGGKPGSSISWSLSASDAAKPIVRLFEQPRRRIVVPGWMAPLVGLAGVLLKIVKPALDWAMLLRAGRMKPHST